ncbi:hypothetical protein GGS24DRAFT_47644 [Hypoxylon argillaceum]|nr:hypothetical protein GGS24DRAFT_47644 [Hypoxylon argillaceum]
MAFRHLTLHSSPGALLPQFPSYALASRVQTTLQQEFLAWKALPPSSRGPPPPPGIICFTPTPTYTLGRRQTEPLSESEIASLRSPLFVPTANASNGNWGASGSSSSSEGINGPGKTAFFLPTIAHAPRGGLTTYHGPGQLVIWPVIDLHSPLHAHLSVRDYACLLEKTTIAALKHLWGLDAFTTANPGVWVRSRGAGGEAAQERKIAALGVHLRRHVTGLGVAINYSTPVTGPVATNPWSRIVPCGLGDRGVTSVCAELSSGIGSTPHQHNDDKSALDSLAETWQSEFQKRLEMHEGAVASDIEQTVSELGAQVKGRDDLLIQARPLSYLET